MPASAVALPRLAAGLPASEPTRGKMLEWAGGRDRPDAERVLLGEPPTGGLSVPAGAPDGAAGAAGAALDGGVAGGALDGAAGGVADVG